MKLITKIQILVFMVFVNKTGLQGYEPNGNTGQPTASLCRCAVRVSRFESRAILLHNAKQFYVLLTVRLDTSV